MALWDGITGVTAITWVRGGPQNFLITWSGPTWDNPDMRAGGYGSVVMAVLFWQAGG